MPLQKIIDYVEHRTGLRSFVRAALYEHIPGGSRWRYVWGSTLVFTFFIQLVTGLFLWMSYSPSAQTAWESVYHLQFGTSGGSLLRGLHHYTAQAMIVLLALHMLQVIVDGAYRAPREFNYWIGLILLLLVLGLGLTGYLLPWDQKGYWATKVATNLIGLTPAVGEEAKRVAIGGAEYGHLTLTRFFAVHAGLLPALMIFFIGLHVYVFRRHGIHARPRPGDRDAYFWPDQVLKDGVACLGVLAVVLILSIVHPAPLLAPAEPSEPYSAARPEWYFLFLFQFLKIFSGESTIWGAIYIPGLIMMFLFLLPVVGRWTVGHWLNVIVIFALLAGATGLTVYAWNHDRKDSTYNLAVQNAERDAGRVRVLARHAGIPPAGAVQLLRDDPATQGPRLFARSCAGCHRWDGHDGTGSIPKEPASAADLESFASRKWLAGFLDPARIATAHYFGSTSFKDGEMVDFVQETVKSYEPAEQAKLEKVILALSAEAGRKDQAELDRRDAAAIEAGKLLMGRQAGDETGLNCVKCHRFQGKGSKKGPELTGYGSREWILGILDDPAHESYYGEENDRMPAFGKQGILDRRSLELIADWLRGDWFEPPASAPPPAAATR